jgi:hypothetical protein
VTHHSADRAAYVRGGGARAVRVQGTHVHVHASLLRATTLPCLALPCLATESIPQSDPPLPASCTVYTQYKYIQTKIRQWCASPLIFFLKKRFSNLGSYLHFAFLQEYNQIVVRKIEEPAGILLPFIPFSF